MLTIVTLGLLPAGIGAVGADLLWVTAYVFLAASFLTGVASMRDPKHNGTSPNEIVIAIVVRVFLVFVIGGMFYLAGSMIA